MMNRNEKLEIAKRLRHLTEMEMSRDDLELLLEAELTKPEAEMDAELIEQLLELLEEGPTPMQQHASWQKLNKRLSFRRWQPAVTGLARIAAAVVLLLAIMFATYGTAQALNWEFLLRLMKPFAETFMVYTGTSPTPTPQSNDVYGDNSLQYTQQTFASLADCPVEIDGYPAKPVWVPERFAYVQGNMYTDLQVTSFSHIFSCTDGWCIVDITKFRSNEDATSYYYEQLPAQNTTAYIANMQVALYQNTDNATMTASWLAENTSYFVSGSISEEEIITMIKSMMK